MTGWYSVLAALREAHPNLLIENCWNGGKPLDLQMIAHHDTTIGDDWCRSEQNRLAALGLGVYLPSSWTSKYMGDEPHLPLRAQLAPYLVGGPWIFMGDLPGWPAEQLAEMQRAGVQIEKFHKPHWYNLARLNNRTHRKLLVVDGRVGFTGPGSVSESAGT